MCKYLDLIVMHKDKYIGDEVFSVHVIMVYYEPLLQCNNAGEDEVFGVHVFMLMQL